jgi:hypothetical protein
MASKAKYVKVCVITDHAKSVAGYRVLGDILEGDARVLLLERPEITSLGTRRRAIKRNVVAAESQATAFPGSSVANG